MLKLGLVTSKWSPPQQLSRYCTEADGPFPQRAT